MKSFFAFVITALTGVQCHSTGVKCGSICGEFSRENGDLGICSSSDKAEIWNSTSGECIVSMDAELKPVSYSSLIFTLGVTPAVRRQIGKECWDHSPETVATWILRSFDSFDLEAACHTFPTNSPSLGWDMRYDMKVFGFSDCSSLVELHQNSLAECVRHKADARAFATLGYMIVVFCGILLFLFLCFAACSCCCDCW